MRKTAATLLGALACALGASGVVSCGDDAAATTSTTTSTMATSSSTGGGPAPIACEGAPAEITLDGVWAAYGRLSVKLLGAPGGAITICPTDQIGEATILLLVTFKQDPADKTKIIDAKATLCSIELPVVTALVGMCDPASESLVSTQIVAPDPFIKSLPKVTQVASTGTLSALSSGAGINLERFIVTAGSSKSGAALPSWKIDDGACAAPDVGHTDCEMACVDDCASMRDDDEDGFPGVTLEVCGKTPDDEKNGVECNAAEPNEPGATLQGRAYLNLEVDPLFTGTAASSCELTGTIDTGVNYNVVGADVYLTGGSISVASAIKSLPTFSVDAAASKFRMVRIDGAYGAPDWQVDPAMASAACATLIQRVNEL
jgi:hypothetical protein